MARFDGPQAYAQTCTFPWTSTDEEYLPQTHLDACADDSALSSLMSADSVHSSFRWTTRRRCLRKHLLEGSAYAKRVLEPVFVRIWALITNYTAPETSARRDGPLRPYPQEEYYLPTLATPYLERHRTYTMPTIKVKWPPGGGLAQTVSLNEARAAQLSPTSFFLVKGVERQDHGDPLRACFRSPKCAFEGLGPADIGELSAGFQYPRAARIIGGQLTYPPKLRRRYVRAALVARGGIWDVPLDFDEQRELRRIVWAQAKSVLRRQNYTCTHRTRNRLWMIGRVSRYQAPLRLPGRLPTWRTRANLTNVPDVEASALAFDPQKGDYGGMPRFDDH